MPIASELTASEEKFFATGGAEAPSEGSPSPAPEPKEPEKGPTQTKADSKIATEPEPEDKAKTVPQGALHEERERRKAAQKEAEEYKTNYTKLQSRLDTLTEIAKTSVAPKLEPQAPQIPDINTDPVGHFRAKTAQLEQELAETRKWRGEQEQRSLAVNNVQRIAQIAQSKEAEFKQTAPDYDAASTHLRAMRDQQLIAYGVADPMERGNIIAQDAITIAATALSQGKNPAQVIYDMAKASGYTVKAPAPEDKGAAPSEADKVRMAAAGQRAGQSLQQINGAASPPTTMESLLEMSDEEFASATSGKNWKKLLGA